MLSARTVSSAAKKSSSRIQALASSSALTLEIPPTPKVKQASTLCRMFSRDGDSSNAGPGIGLSMRDILPHRFEYDNAITQLRSGVGLGIDFNSRDLGTLVPPPTPRLTTSATLSEAGPRRSSPETVEGKALNALTSSKLFMRRRQQAPKPLASISTPSSSIAPSMASLTLNKLPPKSALSLAASTPLSPTMSAIHAYSSSSPTAAGTFAPVAKKDDEPVGLGITIPSANDDMASKEVIFKDEEWEYVKPAGFKSCKGRVCTPGPLTKELEGKYLF